MAPSSFPNSFSPTQSFTQQPSFDRPLTPSLDGPRSPFMPTRKPHSSNSPPASPLSSRGPSSRPIPPPAYLPSTPAARPLVPSTAHNLPAFSLHPSSPTEARQPTRKLLDSNHSLAAFLPSSNAPSTSAPRIRARLTPSATPRRRPLIPGTEFADPPPLATSSRPGEPGSPTKRVLPSPLANTPLQLPSYSNDSFEMDSLDRGLAGLGLGELERKRKGGRENVLVCVRVRPPAAKLASATEAAGPEAWDVSERTGMVGLKDGGTEFSFDSVVTGSDNDGVYQEAGKDLVLAAMEGFDAVIFAYGQTASGKTFTLSGNAANPGIIPQAVTEIFCYIRDHPEKEFLLRASYLEIYNETLKDLLAPESGPLKIRQDEKKRFFVHPLREEVVTGEAQVAALLRRGSENRHTGKTDFNEHSSRSHSVFQMTIESRNESSTPPPTLQQRSKTPNGPRLSPGTNGAVRMSRLSLIDLAGSEQATSQTERRAEGAFINKSLLTLATVIASLTDDSKKKPHVPYRDSKLTQILQPSLAGDARVAVIATMNPSPSAIEETKSTLKFAQRVKKVVLRAVVNEVVDDKALITKYRSHIALLEAQLGQAMALQSVPSTPSPFNAAEDGRKKQSAQIKDLNQQLDELKSLFLTSGNIEDRRHSMLPPRPVSPMKMRRSDTDPSFEEKYLDAKDELEATKEENEDLRHRLAEFEEEHLSELRNVATESEKDARIARLVQANRELEVIAQNVSGESELKKQERKYERLLERCKVYEEGLEATLAKERQKLKVFERFILQHLATQADLITGRRRSSYGIAHGNPLSPDPGFFPLMAESPDLDAISPAFVDLEDLEFSEEGRAAIVRSGSRLLLPM